MLVVYWGRWAGSTGDTGAFSMPVQAGLVGCSSGYAALPAMEDAETDAERIGQTVIITTARRELPDHRETIDTPQTESGHLLTDDVADAA